MMIRSCFAVLFVFSFCAGAVETTIDIDRVSQLQRLEPLTADKIDIFLQARQLTPAQAELVRKHLTPDGKLALPPGAIAYGAPPPAPARAAQAAPVPREPELSRDPYAIYNYKPSDADRELMESLVRDYGKGSRESIGKRLVNLRPAVNPIIHAAFTDPVDLPIKIALWSDVAGPTNPDAAIGLIETHRAAVELARPVLIPYAKDVGGVLIRRSLRSPSEGAAERYFESRELREMILEIEEMISKCPGSAAAVFLMDVYAARYGEGEAPMRDSNRDRMRLVRACGGNHKKFEDDEKKTWTSKLSLSERMSIAEKLIPWLHKRNDDRRRIARNGLMVCAPPGHPHWDASTAEWQRWLQQNQASPPAQPEK